MRSKAALAGSQHTSSLHCSFSTCSRRTPSHLPLAQRPECGPDMRWLQLWSTHLLVLLLLGTRGAGMVRCAAHHEQLPCRLMFVLHVIICSAAGMGSSGSHGPPRTELWAPHVTRTGFLVPWLVGSASAYSLSLWNSSSGGSCTSSWKCSCARSSQLTRA